MKRLCTVKDTGDYKARWGVLGNLNSFEGETFAPTASKKVPWFLYAVFIILGLRCSFATAERPTRPVYGTIEGEYFFIMATLFMMDWLVIFRFYGMIACCSLFVWRYGYIET